MNDTEKRKLENQLLVMGLKSLSDPDLIQQLADMVSHWPGDRHEFLQDLLNECDADKRYEMYSAISPKLVGFKALPLSQYESRIALKAGAMISQRRMRVEGTSPRPINIGNQSFMETDEAQSTHAMVRLCCQRCKRRDQFLGDTPVGAMLKARENGWKRDLTVQKEFCPRCSKKQVMMPAGNA